MSSKHPARGDMVKIIRSSRSEQVGKEGCVVEYKAVDWQSKVKVLTSDDEVIWAWTWDVEVVTEDEVDSTTHESSSRDLEQSAGSQGDVIYF
jgi:hypothetical protein